MPDFLPAPLTRALLTIADRLDAISSTWAVSGSSALALRGFTLTPNDLDIEMAETDVTVAARALGWEASERVDAGGRSVGARGQLHGTPVEIFGGFSRTGPGGSLPPDDAFIRLYSHRLAVARSDVWVQPVEEYVVRAIVAADAARLERVAAAAPEDFTLDETYVAVRLAAARAAR